MEEHRKGKLWSRVNEKVTRILEDLKEDSVANNPRKPVDCCNPPVPPHKQEKSGTPGR